MKTEEMIEKIKERLQKEIGGIIDDDDLLELCSQIIAITIREMSAIFVKEQKKSDEGCEFCRGEDSIEGLYADMRIIKNNLKISISDSIVDIDDWISINYCPMCGIKLEESR